MNLFEKIKFLLSIEKLWEKVKSMNNVMAFLNGKKTLIGLVIIAAYYAGTTYGLPLPVGMLNFGMGLAGVGIAHKFEKLAGVLTAVVTVGHKVLDALQGMLNSLSGQKS